MLGNIAGEPLFVKRGSPAPPLQKLPYTGGRITSGAGAESDPAARLSKLFS